MEDQKIKKLLEDSVEGPSYGFSTKTIRKIEALEASKKRLSMKGNSSIVAYLIPLVFLGLLCASFFLTDSQFSSYDFAFSIPEIKTSWISFNIHFSWLVASLAIVSGFWAWIWWEKSNLSA